MKTLKYVVYNEGNYYVSQCLNVDVSSFGNNIQEAIDNLNEALELYFEESDSTLELIPMGTFISIVRQSGLTYNDFL